MSAPTTPARQLDSIGEAAAYLGVSTKTIRRWIASGDLSAYRAGPRLIRVDHAELDARLRPIPTAGGDS
jgi:excisionase family DNA binding protein